MSEVVETYQQVAPLREKPKGKFLIYLHIATALTLIMTILVWFLIVVEVLAIESILGGILLGLSFFVQLFAGSFGNYNTVKTAKVWYILFMVIMPFYFLFSLLIDPINSVLPLLLLAYAIVMFVINFRYVKRGIQEIIHEQDLIRKARIASKTEEMLQLEVMTHEACKPYPNLIESIGIICGAILWGGLAALWLIGIVVNVLFSLSNPAALGGTICAATIPLIICLLILHRAIRAVKYAFKDQLYKPSKEMPALNVLGAIGCFIVALLFIPLLYAATNETIEGFAIQASWIAIIMAIVPMILGIAFSLAAVGTIRWQKRILKWKLQAPDTTTDEEALLLVSGKIS